MKQSYISKLLLTSLLFLSQSMSGLQLHATTFSKNIQVTEAGKLSSLITSEEKNQITALSVSGDINGTDILYIREMAGRDFNGNATEGSLKELDLSNANIIAGGEPYFKQYIKYTAENNTIGDHMFENSILNKILLPKSTSIIKGNSFTNSTSLSEITIPETVTTIGDLAFKSCTSLTEFSFPKVSKIAGEVLSGCNNLKFIKIPSTVSTIDYMAFANCNKLEKILCSAENVPSIGYNTFQNVPTNETKIYVPRNYSVPL